MDRRRVAYIVVAVGVLGIGRLLHSTAGSPSGSGPGVGPSLEPREPREPRPDRADDRSIEPIPTVSLREPPAAVAELGILTTRTEATLAGVIDRVGLAALVEPTLCGDENACDAVRLTLKDEHATALRVALTSEWAADRAGFDASASALAPVDRASLAKRSTVIVVRVAAPAATSQLSIRTAFAVAAAIAAAIDGLVYDPLLGRIENARTFAKHAVTAPLQASAFRLDRIEVLYEPKGEGVVRLLTAGLERFGAPDVEAAATPTGASGWAAQLVVAVANAIADGARASPIALSGAAFARDAGAVKEDAGSRPVAIPVVSVHPEAGDPNDFIVRIDPPEGDGPMGYLALLENIFGPVLGIPPDEATRRRDGDRAQRALGPALAQWAATRGSGARLLVRVPFAIPGDAGVESMWVEVTGYDARTVTGLVVDEPLATTDVARGDRVTKPRAEVEDLRSM